ncbi:hypothetical protein GGX14DRAFT_524263 [Mycena pura]|uniref:Uncharacterized protein n=1 Tax=Mycena pura TaxID=153505 RepID=A0AAD6Y6C1_9AGAR|nr:hypothetical protein GGX14DRAFT_524263 [Mycena pura]
MSLLRSRTLSIQRPAQAICLFFCPRRGHSRRVRVSWTRSAQNPVLPVIPELFSPNFLDKLIPASTPSTSDKVKPNTMMDALREFSYRTLTENDAPAYDSTLSPTLDAFQTLTQFRWGTDVWNVLDRAWAEDPDTTLRIIWNLRSIHDGKAEKETFYHAFGWLYEKHPRTAITNLHLLVKPLCSKPGQEKSLAHGYWKDLLNILALATHDELKTDTKLFLFLHKFLVRRPKWKPNSKSRDRLTTKPSFEVDLKPVVKASRAAVGAANHARLEHKLTHDQKYRALYIAVARLFADRILTDWNFLLDCQNPETTADQRKALLRNISLAPKWAPSLLGTHDRHTNIATAISRLIYHAKDAVPRTTFPSALENHTTLEAPDATEILRSFYRRWILTPLRSASLVTETFMSANRWKEIPYHRVSSVCMKRNNKHFFKHDPEGFQKYLISVDKGLRTISGATLIPHELIGEIVRLKSAQPRSLYPDLAKHREEQTAMLIRVVEAQWRTLVQNLREAGTLENSVAICDVSGSMGSLGYPCDPKNVQPILPAISLSLLLAQLARPPFNAGFITFSAKPQFVQLDPSKSLYDTVMDMSEAEWGVNTDLNAVFLRLLLPLAIRHKVKPADMIKRLFIFSDMQFDDAGTHNTATAWETNYDLIQQAYWAAGYDVPEIVYWNLSSYTTMEVLAERKGVALISGFSPAMLKIFMGEEEASDASDEDAVSVKEKVKAEFNPLNIMKKALSKPSYADLKVVD